MKEEKKNKKDIEENVKTDEANSQTEELLKRIEELEKENEELKNDYLRARADFDNFRKRKEKEIIEVRDNAIANMAQDLLPAIDNFEMSLKMTDNREMFIKGVEMIHKNLLDTLKSHNIEEFHVDIEKDEFDPYMHEPLMIEDETKEPGKIVNVLSKGYKHKEKIIRPARVQIVKEKEENKEE